MSANVDQKPQGCLATFLSLFRSPSQPTDQQIAESLPYRVRDDFLSLAELSFYQVLLSVLGEQTVICPKVRLADVFFVPNSDNRQSYQNKINQKHLDFLLCDPKTMRPLMGIELDDKSHQRADRAERDALVDGAFEAARLPLIHVQAKQSYQHQEVSALITPYLEAGTSTPVGPIAVSGTTVPICTICNIPLVIRTSSRGKNQGRTFYGCSNYPRCRVTAPVDNVAEKI